MEIEINNLKNLLSNAIIIVKKYDEIAKITGENFNIFSVMRMESDEVKTHSRIIAELLNPKGSHSQGSIFLKLFFAEIKELSRIEDFDFENAKVLVEEHIGLINEDYTKGGYIDIVIKDNNNQIVIENKIYAVDQFGQLLRYKNHYPKCKLLYLTLDCKEPSNESKGNLVLNTDFHCISYENNILDWLNKCHKETIEQPMLREMIKQYINLIKKLTNKATNKMKSIEIIEILKKNITSSFEISSNLNLLKIELYNEFMNNIKEFALENEMTFNEENNNFRSYYGIYLKPKEWRSNFNKICILFENSNFNELFCGVSNEDNIPELNLKNIQEKFISNNYNVNPYWIWKNPENSYWGDNSEIWEDISKGKNGKTYNEIITKIVEIIEIEKS